MVIVLVAAVARNGVIGADGSLPWSIPEDMAHFKTVTTGNPIIMGRATFDSIGRPLPNRTNIVMTRNPSFSEAGVYRAGDVTEALTIAERRHGTDAEVCIIGGGHIYRLFIPIACRMELTIIDAAPRGDAHFPEWDRADWEQTWSEEHPGPPPFEFARLVRIADSGRSSAERNPQHQGAIFDGPARTSNK